MATKDSEQQLSTLIINKVESEEVFQEMIEDELVNEDELYLIEGGSGNELGLSVINGVLCMTYEPPAALADTAVAGYSII